MEDEDTEREAQAERFIKEAGEALAKGNVVKAYPLWRTAMRLKGLPLDWFNTQRPEGEALH